MTGREALDWLFGLQSFGVKLGLDNIRALLRGLGEPQRAYPCLLITGSNGKGSVAAMTSAALRAAGHRVGTYTSPHLVRFTERIAIDGEPLPARRVAPLATAVRAAIATLRRGGELASHPTFFEVVTAMGLLEFRHRAVDVAVLEVGLGGRFDATNASEPVVSVVTAVALEHTKYLGNTLAEIAFEKAGVARSGRPLVTGVSRGPALPVLRSRARELGATLVIAPHVVTATVLGSSRRGLRLALASPRGRYPTLRLPLPGQHQARNAAVAVATLEALPPPLRPARGAVVRGLARTRWPGRLEYVPGRPRLLLDGAHNPHAAQALASWLRGAERGVRTVLVFACMRDKDIGAIVRLLFARADEVVVTTVANPRAAGADELAAVAPPRTRLHRVDDSRHALELAKGLAGKQGLVVVTGSLYLVGEVKAILARAKPPDGG